MAQRYKIRRGDTLGKIARRFYGDARLYKKLALFNGIRNPSRIEVGQLIEVPSRGELLGGLVRPPAAAPGARPSGVAPLATPHGLDGVLATFGNIFNFIQEDGNLSPRWESQFLTRTRLPFSIPLSWDKSKIVRRLY
ncbi:LysM domain-containing protein, partial [Acidobacteriia bacterium AH_259_A11_L15]|nr:LysM domain-containing protein [Acidobacteriia bacterium AH_259_A11_L15]